MLTACPECEKQISDEAETCPHCGKGLKAIARPDNLKSAAKSAAPVFLVLSVVGLVVAFQTPILLISLPILATLAFAVISIFRKEQGRILSFIVIVLGIGIFMLAGEQIAGPTSHNLELAEVSDWNWVKDPDFGSEGAIKWNVEVKNKSPDYLSNVKVELTTYDQYGKLISSDFTYVSSIPPYDTRSTNSFADYYGTETRAVVRIAEVRKAQ